MFTKKVFWRGVLIMGIAFTLWFSQQAAAQERSESIMAVTNSDPVIGDPFTISTGTIDEVYSKVAYNFIDQEYLVVWTNIWAGTNDIYAQRISEDGRFLSWFFVAQGEWPAVAYNEKNNTYLIVYEKWVLTDYDIYAQRVDFTGLLGSEFPVAINLNEDEKWPRVAYNTHPNHDEFLVVWETNIHQPTLVQKVEGQQVAGTSGGGDGGGDTIGTRLPIAVTGDSNFDPDVAYNLNMNEFFVVFTRFGGSDWNVYGRRITWDGDLLPETAIDTSGNDQYEPKVAAYRQNQATPYLVVFNDRWNDVAGDVRGYLVNQQGQPVTLVNISTTPGLMEIEPSISQSESWGGFLVTWTQMPGMGDDIYGKRVSNTGVPGSAFLISRYDPIPLGCDRRVSDNALGVSSGLTVWYDNCGDIGGDDIIGRILGYRVYLPISLR
jgi:hypothetical protein